MIKRLVYGHQVRCCNGCPYRYRYIKDGKAYDCHDSCQKYLKAAERRLSRPYAPKMKGAEV